MTNGYSKREVFDMPTSVNYNQEYTIETLVVADKKMVDFHGVEELKTYVPSLINIVRKKRHSLCSTRRVKRRARRESACSERTPFASSSLHARRSQRLTRRQTYSSLFSHVLFPRTLRYG